MVEVVELTGNLLIIRERFDGDDEELYELVPAVGSKSAVCITDNGMKAANPLKAGFLRK